MRKRKRQLRKKMEEWDRKGEEERLQEEVRDRDAQEEGE